MKFLTHLSLVVLTVAAVSSAPAAETATQPACHQTCGACVRTHQADAAKPTAALDWYVSPKGGDTRKQSQVYAAGHASEKMTSDQVMAKAWFIGPKGGDSRKGVPSEVVPGASDLGNTGAVAMTQCDQGRGTALAVKGVASYAEKARADAACLAACAR